MADRPAARPRPVAATVERDDSLAALNDHLGRFLRQADDVLDEWTRFSTDVRARVDASLDSLGDTVAQAADASVDRVAARVEKEVASRLVARLAARIADVELDRRRTSRLTMAALGASLLANVLLFVLLLRPPPRSPTPAGELPADTVREPDIAPAVVSHDAAPAAVPLDAGVAPLDAAPVAPAAKDAGVAKHPPSKSPPKRRGSH